jgi:tellurite resistance-related uncharacterized protein
VAAYKRTPEFTAQTVPAGLLKAHSTKDGVWGCIHVISGELVYRILDPRREPRVARLSPGVHGIIEPGILHQVQPSGEVNFYVEFLR